MPMLMPTQVLVQIDGPKHYHFPRASFWLYPTSFSIRHSIVVPTRDPRENCLFYFCCAYRTKTKPSF